MTSAPSDRPTAPEAPDARVRVGSLGSSSEDVDLADQADSFADFVSLLEREPVAASGRSRLLGAIRDEGRLAGFAPEVARLLDLSGAEAARLLDAAARPDVYEAGPFPGVALHHVQGGAAVLGAVTGFVRIAGGSHFPEHEHLGEETVLILQGSMLEPETGRVARPGDIVSAGAGLTHTTVARPGPDLVYLVVLFDGLRVDGQEIRASDPRL